MDWLGEIQTDTNVQTNLLFEISVSGLAECAGYTYEAYDDFTNFSELVDVFESVKINCATEICFK